MHACIRACMAWHPGVHIWQRLPLLLPAHCTSGGAERRKDAAYGAGPFFHAPRQ